MILLRKWLPVVLWAALILSAANDQFSDELTAGWLERAFGVVLPEAVNVTLRKAGHVLAYAILGLLGWRAERKVALAMAVALAVAITDETMQSMTITRQGSIYDVLLDTCGAALALGALIRFRGRGHRRRDS